jgi:hypothetical protein
MDDLPARVREACHQEDLLNKDIQNRAEAQGQMLGTDRLDKIRTQSLGTMIEEDTTKAHLHPSARISVLLREV